MPNGGPDDHPLTDIPVHGLEVFGSRVDAIIKEIVDLGGVDELEQRFDLLHLDPRFAGPNRPGDKVDLPELEARLSTYRDELRRDRMARGWEIGDRSDSP